MTLPPSFLSTRPREFGRYTMFDSIASGGMASVHLGRLNGPAGFSRTVAMKRLHPHLASDADFVAMFLDEAYLTVRLHHPNVVPTLDVVEADGELLLILEYIHGVSFAHLMRESRAREEALSARHSVSVIIAALRGLHAAHQASSERGVPLGIVHRDVSPPNLLVGADGVTRVADFGIAKATSRMQQTREGQLKGKLSYMAPEQLQDAPLDGRTDQFALGIVFWELLTNQRLFQSSSEVEVARRVLQADVGRPTQADPAVPVELEAIVMRMLERTPARRFSSCGEAANALGAWLTTAAPNQGTAEVAQFVRSALGEPVLEPRATVSDNFVLELHSPPEATERFSPGHPAGRRPARIAGVASGSRGPHRRAPRGRHRLLRLGATAAGRGSVP